MDKQIVFKTRHFARWMRKTELTNEALCEAVREMLLGLVDADLGGHVFKKRVALPIRSAGCQYYLWCAGENLP